MAEKITGSCNCGRHEYTIPKPQGMNLCHCMDCRKWSGSMHSAHLFVQTDDIETKSPQPRIHKMKGETGNYMERAWCDECGCGIWIRSYQAELKNMTFLKAGLFKKGELPNPTHENWLKNMEPWETPATGTKHTADANFDSM